jgi:murein DD-endopeptidase MepM/ murein hydrolase activator NlpD
LRSFAIASKFLTSSFVIFSPYHFKTSQLHFFIFITTFNLSKNKFKEFELPLTFTEKTFFEETIELDAKNTEIKTDNSPKRASQIDKLNSILLTIMPSDVYSLEKMTVPTDSTRYTSYFGDRRTYAYTNGKSSTSIHHGNDYGVPTGTPINSCAAGRVVMAEDRISTGYSVVIEHLPGLYSLYYHLSELLVKEGDMIKQGELIGKSGATGLATGPHLHWEMRLNGASVRPEFFLSNFTFEQE